MKIVIVSDTHGSRKNIENVCECNPDADMLISLSEALETPVSILLGETVMEPEADAI